MLDRESWCDSVQNAHVELLDLSEYCRLILNWLALSKDSTTVWPLLSIKGGVVDAAKFVFTCFTRVQTYIQNTPYKILNQKGIHDGE